MGQKYDVICKACGHRFSVSIGGGFTFHLLHCEKCGEEKSIGFDELGEKHFQYLKGLNGPYCIASAEHDEAVRKTYKGKPISEEEYHLQVEEYAGKCKCGGALRFEATARCPECKSTDYEENPEGSFICYD